MSFVGLQVEKPAQGRAFVVRANRYSAGMGLRALAHYPDRHEAVIVQSMLAQAGLLAIIRNEDLLRMAPYYTFALGGYCVLVSDVDLDEAIALIEEARRTAIPDGEVLVVEGDLLDRVVSLVLGFLAGGAPVVARQRRWRTSD